MASDMVCIEAASKRVMMDERRCTNIKEDTQSDRNMVEGEYPAACTRSPMEQSFSSSD